MPANYVANAKRHEHIGITRFQFNHKTRKTRCQEKFCEPGRNRAFDTRIKKRALQPDMLSAKDAIKCVSLARRTARRECVIARPGSLL